MAKKQSLSKEVHDVEKYEYLLVEYIKQISNELTYLMMILATLFLFILLDISPELASTDYSIVKLVLAVTIIGGFALFGISSMIKRKIEKKFERIFA